MSFGLVLLSAVVILLLFGVGQRVMDRMRMNDKAAIVVMLLIIGLSFVPNIVIGRVSINLGGALVPLGVCIYLLVKTENRGDWWRAAIGSVVTAAAIYVLGLILPAEPERIVIDPVYIQGLVGGAVAYIISRSRRNAFISAVLGLILCDVFVAALNWANGVDQALVLGTAGVLDSIVIAGLMAVILAELVGELIERVTRGKQAQPRSEVVYLRGKKGGR